MDTTFTPIDKDEEKYVWKYHMTVNIVFLSVYRNVVTDNPQSPPNYC
jgi:hypothetical protein